jgi:hypothetical protein
MRTRSDSTLRRLLERIKELGGSEALHQMIDDALRHMGDRHPYRGGRDLLALLRYAEKVCRDDDDEDSLERIEDALAYAMNTMLRPDVEIKYQLFADSRDRYLQQVRGTVELVSSVATLYVDDVIRDKPDASASDVREYLERLRHSPGFIVEDERHPGRYREASLDHSRVRWADLNPPLCIVFCRWFRVGGCAGGPSVAAAGVVSCGPPVVGSGAEVVSRVRGWPRSG